MEDREELLKGLYTVKHYLQQIQDNELEQPNFEPDLLEEKPYLTYQPKYQEYVNDREERVKRIGLKNTPDMIIMTVAMAIGIIYFFQALLQASFVDVAVVVVAMVILYQTIGQWSVKRVLALIILIYATVNICTMVMRMVSSSGPFILVLYLVFFAVAVVICARVVVVKNRKIDTQNVAVDEHNQAVEEKNRRIKAHNQAEEAKKEQISQKNREIERQNILISRENDKRMEHYHVRLKAWTDEKDKQFRALVSELIGLTGHWYPKDYYSMYAVDCFIGLVENFRADTVKEMVNLFETDQYHKNMLQKQNEFQNLLQQTQEQIRVVNQNIQENRQTMERGFHGLNQTIGDGLAKVTENQQKMRRDIYFATLSQLEAMRGIDKAIRGEDAYTPYYHSYPYYL